MRQRLKSQLITPTVFVTVSPPRNEFARENPAPFGCRVNLRVLDAEAVVERDPADEVVGQPACARAGLRDRGRAEVPRLTRERKAEHELAEAVVVEVLRDHERCGSRTCMPSSGSYAAGAFVGEGAGNETSVVVTELPLEQVVIPVTLPSRVMAFSGAVCERELTHGSAGTDAVPADRGPRGRDEDALRGQRVGVAVRVLLLHEEPFGRRRRRSRR